MGRPALAGDILAPRPSSSSWEGSRPAGRAEDAAGLPRSYQIGRKPDTILRAGLGNGSPSPRTTPREVRGPGVVQAWLCQGSPYCCLCDTAYCLAASCATLSAPWGSARSPPPLPRRGSAGVQGDITLRVPLGRHPSMGCNAPGRLQAAVARQEGLWYAARHAGGTLAAGHAGQATGSKQLPKEDPYPLPCVVAPRAAGRAGVRWVCGAPVGADLLLDVHR